jgi:hypothetical protein
MTPGEPAESNPMPIIALDRYASLPTGELVLFAVQHLHADGVPATLEEVVSICFKLFPHRFALKNYFYWPDSAQVVQALNDAREKGFIKESPADGFIVRPAGRQVAKQAARAMGVPMPMPPRVEKPKPAEPQPEPESVIPPPEPPKEAAPAAKRKKRAAKVKKKTEEKAKPKPKKAKPAKKKTAVKPKPLVKKTARKKAKVEKAVLPAKKKGERIQKRKTRGAKRKPAPSKVKGTKGARQLPLLMPAPAKPKPVKRVAAKKPAKPKPSKKVSFKKPAKAKISKPAAPSVSREEKIKAGKFIHLMERSDAYRQYRKFGRKARISEFDFRNMLFATMESSAETLKRNVELYKHYAGIHNRADLLAFLDFAEGSFVPLLRTQAKQPRRKR